MAAMIMAMLGFAVPYTFAEDEVEATTEVKKEETKAFTGKLDAIKDAEDNVVKAILTVTEKDLDDNNVEVVYNIVLDEKGKELVKALADKKVEVTAVLNKKEIEVKNDEGETEKQTELWLTVKSYKEIVEKVESSDSDSE
jgi:hypothetical protein